MSHYSSGFAERQRQANFVFFDSTPKRAAGCMPAVRLVSNPLELRPEHELKAAGSAGADGTGVDDVCDSSEAAAAPQGDCQSKRPMLPDGFWKTG